MITAGLICVAAGLGALWHWGAGGALVDHAVAAASHHVQAGFPATFADVLLY
ncbi:hypothetical protein HLV37_02365 [Eggerthellaceae bacterium zg-1084]|uniref:hypothetical protein n=1 Tax=Berryella wangjianweii TaxID=2734634 RepID=UPI0015530765|nr:hypothetical protein [Berryella wangjianweii]NPD30724.1 hypothetical protein [Berryella wangjianweii]